MKQLLSSWVAIYHQAYPRVEVAVDVRDSSYPPKAMIAGSAQLGLMGRLLWDDEKTDLVRAWGQTPQRLSVAGATYGDRKKTQAEAIFVPVANPIRGLSFEQLDAIFSAERRRGAKRPALTWGDLGLTGDWARRPIHPVVVKTTVGHALFFRETVLLGGPWRAGLPEYAEDKVAPEGVAPDPNAIGLSCVPFGAPGTRMLALADKEGDEFVPPSPDTVASRRYPLSRLLYLFRRATPDDPLTREFARMTLSREGQQAVLAAGFLPLPPPMVDGELAQLK